MVRSKSCGVVLIRTETKTSSDNDSLFECVHYITSKKIELSNKEVVLSKEDKSFKNVTVLRNGKNITKRVRIIVLEAEI